MPCMIFLCKPNLPEPTGNHIPAFSYPYPKKVSKDETQKKNKIHSR